MRMSETQFESTSKFLSLVLRHKPEQIGLRLDKAGWAEIDELVDRAVAAGVEIDRPMIESIATSCPKQRFTISEDRQRIRANQGHSIDVDLQLKSATPPDVLFHGTAKRFLDSILIDGLEPGQRRYIHLSDDYEEALAVGQRYGKPVVLLVDSKNMLCDGYTFLRSESGIWLTNTVPAIYLKPATINTMITDFECAYYFYLTGKEYQSKMIACGIKTLLISFESINAALLAGADSEDSESFITYFRDAAKEIGVVLPQTNKNHIAVDLDELSHDEMKWVAVKTIEFVSRSLLTLYCYEEILFRIWFIYFEIKKWDDDSVREYVAFIEGWIDYCNSTIVTSDAYWTVVLDQHCRKVENSSVSKLQKKVVRELTSVIGSVSYGSPTSKHLADLKELTDAILEGDK